MVRIAINQSYVYKIAVLVKPYTVFYSEDIKVASVLHKNQR